MGFSITLRLTWPPTLHGADEVPRLTDFCASKRHNRGDNNGGRLIGDRVTMPLQWLMTCRMHLCAMVKTNVQWHTCEHWVFLVLLPKWQLKVTLSSSKALTAKKKKKHKQQLATSTNHGDEPIKLEQFVKSVKEEEESWGLHSIHLVWAYSLPQLFECKCCTTLAEKQWYNRVSTRSSSICWPNNRLLKWPPLELWICE